MPVFGSIGSPGAATTSVLPLLRKKLRAPKRSNGCGTGAFTSWIGAARTEAVCTSGLVGGGGGGCVVLPPPPPQAVNDSAVARPNNRPRFLLDQFAARPIAPPVESGNRRWGQGVCLCFQ